MMKMISDLIQGNTNIDNKVIAESMMTTAKKGALLYLNSSLTSTTTELRAIYAASAAHMGEGDAALTALSIKKGWVKPDETPLSMLSCAVDEAKKILDKKTDLK